MMSLDLSAAHRMVPEAPKLMRDTRCTIYTLPHITDRFAAHGANLWYTTELAGYQESIRRDHSLDTEHTRSLQFAYLTDSLEGEAGHALGVV